MREPNNNNKTETRNINLRSQMFVFVRVRAIENLKSGKTIYLKGKTNFCNPILQSHSLSYLPGVFFFFFLFSFFFSGLCFALFFIICHLCFSLYLSLETFFSSLALNALIDFINIADKANNNARNKKTKKKYFKVFFIFTKKRKFGRRCIASFLILHPVKTKTQ